MFDFNAEVASWPSLGTLELEVLRPIPARVLKVVFRKINVKIV